MASSLKGIDAVPVVQGAAGRRIAIVHTQWNREVVGTLVSGAVEELKRQGVQPANIFVTSVRVQREEPEYTRRVLYAVLARAARLHRTHAGT